MTSKIDELYKTIQNSDYLLEPQEAIDFLKFCRYFPSTSFTNTLLLYHQNKQAQHVEPFNKWQSFGYSVKKGEKSLKIVAPVKDKDGATRFEVSSVFDISQTTCPKEKYQEFLNNDSKILDTYTPKSAFEKEAVSLLLGNEDTSQHFIDVYEKSKQDPEFAPLEELKNAKKIYYQASKQTKAKIKQTVPQFSEKSVSLDDIKQNVSILAVASDFGYTIVPKGKLFSLKEHDSVRIYPDTNSFCRYSQNVGGSVIDFVKHFNNVQAGEAIAILRERYYGKGATFTPRQEIKKAVVENSKEFVLPQKHNGHAKRVFAYLTTTRQLDKDIVQRCFKEGTLYEDARHNAVFVGYDQNNKPAFATKRGTLTNSSNPYRGDVANSNQSIGFILNNKADFLYVTEAPIDALSIPCLLRLSGKDPEKASYVSLCGVNKDKVLYHHLEQNPQTKEIVFALDHDEAGERATSRIAKNISENYPNLKVSNFEFTEKDINAYLVKQKNQTQEVER